MSGCIYYLCVYMGDNESGHCQGACHSQWFFYIPLQGNEMALPFMWSCEPQEIHSLQCWRARNTLPQACPACTEDWTQGCRMTGTHATTCAVATLLSFMSRNICSSNWPNQFWPISNHNSATLSIIYEQKHTLKQLAQSVLTNQQPHHVANHSVYLACIM